MSNGKKSKSRKPVKSKPARPSPAKCIAKTPPVIYSKWPDGNECVDIEELIEPLCKALREGYRLTRINPHMDIPYEGYNIGLDVQIGAGDVKNTLSRESLVYHKERGRDLLHVVIMLAVQLGIEQGARIFSRQHLEQYTKSLVRWASYIGPEMSYENAESIKEDIKRLYRRICKMDNDMQPMCTTDYCASDE